MAPGAKRKLPHFRRPTVPRRLDLALSARRLSRALRHQRRAGARATPRSPIELKIPITIAGMSFGSLSGPAKEALGRGATLSGTSTTTGRRLRMTEEERGHSKTLVYQYLPSRYGMNLRDLRRADAIEVVVGQGAKPGGGGMLLGQKISDRVAKCAPAQGHRPALASRHPALDRSRRSRDQDPRTARNHRLGKADLRQGSAAPAPTMTQRLR
ncbi:glutamate synthase-related protein [Mesorhizobium calcicola]|uniref:Glutamate synthase-related protein n=1 Tax=Mesorhizobium calcicola TaxID=1300310 RepID=A0ABW4WPZ6_9HYPH